MVPMFKVVFETFGKILNLAAIYRHKTSTVHAVCIDIYPLDAPLV